MGHTEAITAQKRYEEINKWNYYITSSHGTVKTLSDFDKRFSIIKKFDSNGVTLKNKIGSKNNIYDTRNKIFTSETFRSTLKWHKKYRKELRALIAVLDDLSKQFWSYSSSNKYKKVRHNKILLALNFYSN